MSTQVSKIRVDGDGGAGGDALAGYEYQIDVSVWLALDLILANKLTHELVLEPASQEDLEADLDEFAPGRVTSQVPMNGYRLVVQAKLRTGDAWTVNGIKSLLKHGSDGRESAAKRLAAPGIRYLLVTSAALNGKTRGLRVRRAGVWPNEASMPASIRKILPVGAGGCVAVISNQDEERLISDIKRLLTESFRVPNARWDECHRTLREEARIRISRAGSGRWRRTEIEYVIRSHDGYIASSPELEHYVHPTNWNELRSVMNSRHAALIIGQSGTGKTMATKKLFEELREIIPGLSHVPITLGPQQLRDDRTEPPVLYDIEDPWGRFDFDPNSRPWNDQLAQLFTHATHNRMIVATSRLDVAQTAGAIEGAKPWMVALEAEHYGGQERHQLYQTRIGALPRELQVIATRAEKIVLGELGTPLEIQKFFDALPTIDRQSLDNRRLITEAIRRAHKNSIERTVIDQIEERDDLRAAAVVWGLLKANDKLSLRILRIIEEKLVEEDQKLSEGVSPLITFFVAARNLRQSEEIVTYYHPRVESGIEQTLIRHALLTRQTLRRLVDVLTSPDGPGEDWGTAAAVRLVTASAKLAELKPKLSPSAQNKIDAWLTTQVAQAGNEFETNLRLAAAAGSADNAVSEAARYLLNRTDRSGVGFSWWESPQHDEAWYALLRADPAVKSLIKNFIRDILPTEHDNFPKEFAIDVERLVPDVSEAFLAAAERVVHFGVTYTSDAIAEGALKYPDRFEAIVNAAIEVLTPTEDDQREAEETHLAIINSEYSEDYAEHLANDDDGYTANEFLEAYVERVRRTRGWSDIASHHHRTHLLSFWLRALAKEAKEGVPKADEVGGAFAAGYGSKDERTLWFILVQAWDSRYLNALKQRVIDGHEVRAIRLAALICLAEHASEQVAEISRILIARGDQSRLIEMAIELSELRDKRSEDGDRHTAAVEAAVAALPDIYNEISEAAFVLTKSNSPVLSNEACNLVGAVCDASEAIRRFRLALGGRVAHSISDDVRWLLANTTDSNVALEAINAAIQNGYRDAVEGALDHRFAYVSARALTSFAMPLPTPLPDKILTLAQAKGSPIRMALVELLDAKPHEAHLPTLLRLVRDNWSERSSYYRGQDDYPIAQAAASAIAKLGSLAIETAEQLYHVAIESSDPDLRFTLLELLARNGGSKMQERVFDLAVGPGQLEIKRAAAGALLQAEEALSLDVITRITSNLLATRIEPVSSRLTLLYASKAETESVVRIAEALATHPKRRILLVLIIWVMKDRDRQIAERIADMLPANHVAVSWAFGADIAHLNDSVLADLGDPAITTEILNFMKPKKE